MSYSNANAETDKPVILVVDDDERLRELLLQYLSDHDYFVIAAEDAKQARQKLAFFACDAMILDVMMPGETGIELAQSLQDDAPPILMLTAMGETEDRIKGLETGARDYLVKPFEPRELLLRIGNIVERQKQAKQEEKSVRFGAFRFDLQASKLYQDNEPVYLTSSESQCLAALAQKAGTPVAREDLAEAANPSEGKSNDRSVDVQINRLRKKIEPVPGRPVYIQTVRGAGYVLHPT
ncbi:MAG: response regulator, partial [Rickettsiales bacterium]|nr:response regulator [Rickettsiales bacterium]